MLQPLRGHTISSEADGYHVFGSYRSLCWRETFSSLWGTANLANWVIRCLVRDSANTFSHSWLTYFSGPSHGCFLDVLRQARRLFCTDDRDRIYAFIGIDFAPSPVSEALVGLQPDYSQSVERIYCDFACLCIENNEALYLLSEVDQSPEPTPKLPSWVPDWRLRTSCELFYYIRSSEPSWTHQQRRITADRSDYTLKMEGIDLDTIYSTMHQQLNSESMLANLRAIGQYWRRITNRPNALYLEFQNYDEIAVSLLRYITDAPEKFGLDYHWCNHHHCTGGHHHQTTWPDPRIVEDTMIWNMIESLLRARDRRLKQFPRWFQHRAITSGREWRERKLFQSRNGWLGIGPSGMLDDDRLVLLHDNSIPFLAVLRKKSGGHIFIGLAVVVILLDTDFEGHRELHHNTPNSFVTCKLDHYNGLEALWSLEKKHVQCFKIHGLQDQGTLDLAVRREGIE